ncbi:hypothetical protein GCM10020218_035040 [Dactylosporangium vinaceum]
MPVPAAGEITEKGYVNQRAVRERRSDLVTALQAEPPQESMSCSGDAARPSGAGSAH